MLLFDIFGLGNFLYWATTLLGTFFIIIEILLGSIHGVILYADLWYALAMCFSNIVLNKILFVISFVNDKNILLIQVS